MSNTKHTPEPWVVHAHVVLSRGKDGSTDTNVSFCTRRDDQGRYSLEIPYEEAEANAARIVACVNSCKGVENEWLQSNGVQALIEERDELAKKWEVVKHLELDAYHQLKADYDNLNELKNELASKVQYLETCLRDYRRNEII